MDVEIEGMPAVVKICGFRSNEYPCCGLLDFDIA